MQSYDLQGIIIYILSPKAHEQCTCMYVHDIHPQMECKFYTHSCIKKDVILRLNLVKQFCVIHNEIESLPKQKISNSYIFATELFKPFIFQTYIV